jgi:cell division protein FtsQ
LFEVDPGSRAHWQAQAASSLEPHLGFEDRARRDNPFAKSAYHSNYASSPASGRSKRGHRLSLWIAVLAVIGGMSVWSIKYHVPEAAGAMAGSSGLRSKLDGFARLTGFGIDMVVLTGHRFTTDSDIFDALDLPNARSLMSFDTEGVRRRLERLPWVLSADLTRVFPDRLDVRVTERKAFAVWMHDGHSQLIDESGRVLSAINRDDGLGLLRVSGEGAASDAQPFLTLLMRYPGVISRLENAERVGRRRWTLHLSGGLTVHLPANREAAVLDTLAAGGGLVRLLEMQNRIIDLRGSGRIAIRQDVARPARSAGIVAPETSRPADGPNLPVSAMPPEGSG